MAFDAKAREGRDKQRMARLVCGGVVFRLAGPGAPVELLLVSAKKRQDWIFPKGTSRNSWASAINRQFVRTMGNLIDGDGFGFPGGWETDETAEQCVVRECWEEGGVQGTVICPLTVQVFTSPKGNDSVLSSFLLMVPEVLPPSVNFPEAGERAQQWVSVATAHTLVLREEMVAMLRAAEKELRNRGYSV